MPFLNFRTGPIVRYPEHVFVVVENNKATFATTKKDLAHAIAVPFGVVHKVALISGEKWDQEGHDMTTMASGRAYENVLRGPYNYDERTGRYYR